MKRPDYTDQAQARDRAAARHKRCVCGDRQPCSCTPSPGWRARGWRPVFWGDLRLLWRYVLQQTQLITSLGEKIMASQADVDAIAAALHQEDSDLNAAVSSISAKIADLQAQIDAGQPVVDLSGLQAEVDGLRGAVDSAAALVPAPADNPPADGGDVPAEPPVEEPAPEPTSADGA